IDYLTDSMNYIPVSLENQTNQHAGTSKVTNPHAGTSEVTNSAGTLQYPNANASEEADDNEELIVVPTTIKHSAAKVGPRKSSTNSKEEKFLTELQNLQTQENEAYSTGISEDTPEILAFRRELDELAPKHLREYMAEERTMTMDDLLQLVPKLITKVDSLETELKQTKVTIGKALVKLVKKVKKMEDVLKNKHVVFKTPTQSKTLGEEDINPTTLEAAKTLSKIASQRSKSADKGKRYKRRKESKGKDIDTGFEDISTVFEEVNTGGLGVSTGSGPVSSAR
ncbi:hypothetical protein Tco_0080734, partial [Tanacetum coccineum]